MWHAAAVPPANPPAAAKPAAAVTGKPAEPVVKPADAATKPPRHKEAQGNERGAAGTYHQLGRIAEEQHDFAGAGRFFLKALGVFAAKNGPV